MGEVSNIMRDAEKWISRLKKRELLLPPDAPRVENKELEQAEAALADLRVSKAKIDEDYQAKHLAWKIDVSCRTLVPIRIDARPIQERPEFRRTMQAAIATSPTALQSSGILALG